MYTSYPQWHAANDWHTMTADHWQQIFEICSDAVLEHLVAKCQKSYTCIHDNKQVIILLSRNLMGATIIIIPRLFGLGFYTPTPLFIKVGLFFLLPMVSTRPSGLSSLFRPLPSTSIYTGPLRENQNHSLEKGHLTPWPLSQLTVDVSIHFYTLVECDMVHLCQQNASHHILPNRGKWHSTSPYNYHQEGLRYPHGWLSCVQLLCYSFVAASEAPFFAPS